MVMQKMTKKMCDTEEKKRGRWKTIVDEPGQKIV
jgi:hypothetical protein